MITICKYLRLTKNKGIEFQFDVLSNITKEWIRIVLESRSKQDHPGVYFEISLFKLFSLIVHFYGGRHWDYENDCYVKY